MILGTNISRTKLGAVVEEQMQLNEIGNIVAQCWEDIPKHFPNVELRRSRPFGR